MPGTPPTGPCNLDTMLPGSLRTSCCTSDWCLADNASLCEMKFAARPGYNASLCEMKFAPAEHQMGSHTQGVPACCIPVADNSSCGSLPGHLLLSVGTERSLTMIASHCACTRVTSSWPTMLPEEVCSTKAWPLPTLLQAVGYLVVKQITACLQGRRPT